MFLTNLTLKNINEYDKIYIYSPSLYQDLYQRFIKCFSKYISIHIIPNVLNEKDMDIVIEELCNDKDFQKSDIEIEKYESVEETNYRKEYEDGGNIILKELNN